MSRARHHEKHEGHDGHKPHRASGGRTEMKVSGNPDVFKEAEERKHGGKVKHKHHPKKHMGKVHGEPAKHRMDRPHRKAGGRVGADKNPLSSAHHGGSAGEREHGEPD